MKPADSLELRSLFICELKSQGSHGFFSRLLAHLLIRLLVVSPLPASLQAWAAFFPVSLLAPLVATASPGGEKAAVEGTQVPQDAWGNFRFPQELGADGDTVAAKNRFAFTGYLWDKETNLFFAKARFYDPEVGRFISQDSYLGAIEDPPSLHRYFYANDNPTRYVDPTGHCIECPVELGRMTPEERVAFLRQQQEAGARVAGGLVGAARWAAKTALGMLKFAMGMGQHPDASEETRAAQAAPGRFAVETVEDPTGTPGRIAAGVKRDYDEALDRAGERIARGDHFGAAAGFTEEFTAPTAATALTVGEGVSSLAGAAVKRTVPTVSRAGTALSEALEAQARQGDLAVARAIVNGRRSELGTVGRIMTDEQAQQIVARADAPSRGVWEKGPGPRGLAIEDAAESSGLRSGRLPKGFQGVDFHEGVVTSTKSVDLSLPSYQDPVRLQRRLQGYVDKLEGFEGGALSGKVIRPSDIAGRQLDVFIPPGPMTASQRLAIETARAYASSRGIPMNMMTVK